MVNHYSCKKRAPKHKWLKSNGELGIDPWKLCSATLNYFNWTSNFALCTFYNFICYWLWYTLFDYSNLPVPLKAKICVKFSSLHIVNIVIIVQRLCFASALDKWRSVILIVLNWLLLTDRSQFVKFNGSSHDYSVMQESVLEPSLCSLYASPLWDTARLHDMFFLSLYRRHTTVSIFLIFVFWWAGFQP